jgi:DUF4097 and DUF4098 domain-containing protein YvlB
MNARSSNIFTHCVPFAILLTTGFVGCANAEEYTKSYTVSGRANVRVHADNGGVHVTPSDDNKVGFEVTYDKSAWGSGSDAGPKIDSRQDGNTVELTALTPEHSWFGFFSGNRSLKIEVHMPRNADLDVETSNGGVDVSSVNGNITIHTSNGGIRAEQLSGTIVLGSSNGGMTLDSLKGALKAHTSNGAINATSLECKCDFGTSNGAVRVAGRFESLDITTGNGRVEARAEAGSSVSSPWSIRTSNSGVDLSLPTGLKANLDASTTNGGITLNLPVQVQGYQSGTEIHGTLQGGGPEISIHTTNGGIAVRGI